MATTIRSFMDGTTTAFEFDETLTEVSNSTTDRTVRFIREALWYHYDDCVDHKIVAAKIEWDYFNRMLLLLDSESKVVTTESPHRWGPLQASATLLLTLFVSIAARVGFGIDLVLYAIPFGPPSILLSWVKRRRLVDGTDAALTPFPSFGALRAVRQQVKGFARFPYLTAMTSRQIRSPFADKLLHGITLIQWCLFSPVVLFFQALPARETGTRSTLSTNPNGAAGEAP